MSAAVSWLDHEFTLTTFKNRAARTKREEVWTLLGLKEHILSTTAATKSALPWLKWGRFGNVQSRYGCLRHNDNVLACTGLEGDYDSGKIAFDTAVQTMKKAGILGIIYTSPSNCLVAPRWRVLCPFSREYPPEQRDVFMGRLNGVFAGVFAGESWVLSQSYFYQRVAIHP